ncbi:aminoglycoside 6-adenylyltransferase [Cupriavidus cauae]|jgi:Streptomycin adenylyltransferase.|uniref:aminoglycoside 6-adenylyltransferase n=1 Tax=Cupriavidus TaxID=106589 RepID=UPI001CF22C3C|nr:MULTISPECIES: aminoglycoside 6-adenylyltransferase [Cupriavidus]MCA7085320.1 aminoglycoside 6-adenylyltransferase [Cupriavidus sp. DB3]UZN50416.1 aminoglycoside 6-adenylyltransferase [Cupriavidus cauae]
MTLRDQYLQSVLAWAGATDAVLALIQTGSLARQDDSADEYSDLDIEIISSDSDTLAKDDDWLHRIGPLITVLRLEAGSDQPWPTRLAIYQGGVKIDFTVAGIERLRRMTAPDGLDDLYARGYHVLLDKAGVAASLPPPPYRFPVEPLPSQREFQASVEEFWFEAFHVPRYLARGEPWLVKQRDWTMKTLLLRMAQWHAQALHPGQVDVWHNGLRMDQWAHRDTWHAMQQIFGRFDAADARRAFEATVRLYGRLGREVAERAGLEYPEACEDQIQALNRAVLGAAN